jgi:ectoine hydroxylase-related dioxygenase (phytanoyl-CoA dioxygenase family)
MYPGVIAGDYLINYLTPEQLKEFKPIPVETKAGEALFHHPLTMHGSNENKSNRPRRAFVINAFADGVVSDSDDALLTGVPPVPKGKKMEGQFFPMLFEGVK